MTDHLQATYLAQAMHGVEGSDAEAWFNNRYNVGYTKELRIREEGYPTRFSPYDKVSEENAQGLVARRKNHRSDETPVSTSHLATSVMVCVTGAETGCVQWSAPSNEKTESINIPPYSCVAIEAPAGLVSEWHVNTISYTPSSPGVQAEPRIPEDDAAAFHAPKLGEPVNTYKWGADLDRLLTKATDTMRNASKDGASDVDTAKFVRVLADYSKSLGGEQAAAKARSA
jgi:hypothetical protein